MRMQAKVKEESSTAAQTDVANDNGEAITVIDGYAVCSQFGDGVARIRDEELAKKLGYAQPRQIRELIKRLVKDRKLNDVSQSRTARLRADGMPSKPATVYWLTEPQALKVIAKSETDLADAILDEVIQVFVEWRHGRLGAVSVSAAEFAELQKKLISLQLEVARMRDGFISPTTLGQLRADVRRIAMCEVAACRWKTIAAARADIYRELRDMTGWGGRGQKWALAPAGLAHPASVVLRGRDASIQRELKLLAAERQMRLPEVPPEPEADPDAPPPKGQRH